MQLPSINEDDFHYAMENTRVLYEPDRRIDTFGATEFEFELITEPMDAVDQVRIRTGRIQAERPVILKPDLGGDFEFEGFGEQAAAFGAFLRDRLRDAAFLKYGFTFKKQNITESLTADSVELVCENLIAGARQRGNPMHAVIHGVDEAWEACLIKFTIEMIQKSAKINLFDFKRRGLL
jgi:hypothetical protein